MEHYKRWCFNQTPRMKLQDAMELAMDNLTGRLGVLTPTVVSTVVVCVDPPTEDPATHTTEQHSGRQDAQRPQQPNLPTGLGLVGMPPTKSEFSLEVNLEYAWDAYRNDRGIKKPDAWAMANLRSGKYDGMIRMWQEGKQQHQLPELRECRRCLTAFRPKEGGSLYYCSETCAL